MSGIAQGRRRLFFAAQLAGMIAAPAVLLWAAVARWQQSALITALVALAAVAPFFLGFEDSHPQPRELVPVAVMASIAILGRVTFAPVPGFKPASAVIIIAGLAFGPQTGFLTGAVTALGSNMFFGQGAWTAWQMYAWGMMGFGAGYLGRRRLFQKPLPSAVFGFAASVFYGWFLNLWTLAGFVRPVTAVTVAATYLASLPMDLAHGASTFLFLLLLQKPWLKKLRRIKEKYGIGPPAEMGQRKEPPH